MKERINKIIRIGKYTYYFRVYTTGAQHKHFHRWQFKTWGRVYGKHKWAAWFVINLELLKHFDIIFSIFKDDKRTIS